MPLTGNKGEWSEIYALFKVLGDKQLNAGDQDLNKLLNVVYPIVSVLRTESDGTYKYDIDQEIVFISSKDKKLLKISVAKFKEKAAKLLDIINESTGTTFSSPEIEEFMKKIHCSSIKASSSAKTDITIIIHDDITGQEPTLGFSIKSQLGSASTLLNASRSTNFIYKLDKKLLDTHIDEINNINDRSGKIKKRIERIVKYGSKLNFETVGHQIFFNNLTLIDSRLPEILAHMVLCYYSSNNTTMKDLISEIKNSNPLKYDMTHSHNYYSYKIKHFLTDIALGMMPQTIWNGKYDATGGYLIIKSDGEVLCYHIYNKNEFENYLISNTKLETASSSKHNFGKIYDSNDELFINLNLQIRFIK